MPGRSTAIARATPADLPGIETLLAAAGLPLDGIADAFALGVVARAGDGDGDGPLVGAAAVEPYGSAGLLRSVVVAEELRGSGVGRTLVGAAESLARDAGLVELHLLTETAADWFPRLGYEPIDRTEAAAAIGASSEFRTACSVTAVPMRKRLG